MPLYSFICDNPACTDTSEQYEFEVLYHTFKEATEQDWALCPKCQKRARKIPSISARMKWNWSRHNPI